MSIIKDRLRKKIEEMRPRVERLVKEYGDIKVDEVRIKQVIGGMRGVKCLTTDISYLDPLEGIRFRGLTIPETLEALPKVPGSNMPYVEGFFYFLLTGDIPGEAELKEIHEGFRKRRQLPDYVLNILKSMPIEAHPMSMLSTAVVAMQKESIFTKEYHNGLSKFDYWDPMYEDVMNLLARLPVLASYIYRIKYKGGDIIEPNADLDVGGNFAHMMGIDKPYDDVARLYFILHSDHESGNVSAHTGHLIASALSDIYFAFSGMLNGLAGPLHGLANQEVLRWIQGVYENMGGKIPTDEEMSEFVWETLSSGQVIPGFGHAVLRKTDPRYTAQRDFCLQHLPDDPLFKYVDILYRVVPPILKEQGKAKNLWPNVDVQSGVIQWYYGVREYDFYTVLFGIGRAIGVGANIIWDRALGFPIERPKSITTTMLEKIAGIRKT